jgi:hypothetical protein
MIWAKAPVVYLKGASRYFCEETEEKHEHLSQGSRKFVRDSYQDLLSWNAERQMLHEPTQLQNNNKKRESCPCAWTEHHAMKAYWGIGGIAPRILDPSTRWRWVVSFTPRLLYPQGKSPWYPLDRRLGGPQSRSGRGGKEKNSQSPPGIEP